MVIGILAAISIVAYNGISNNANDAAVKNDLANFAKKMEVARIEAGRYPRHAATEFPAGFKFTQSAYSTKVDNAMLCIVHSSDEYALTVVSKSNRRYTLTKNGVQESGSWDPCVALGMTWNGIGTLGSRIRGFSSVTGWSEAWT